MKQSLQLRIPAPCGEDWARMQPAEKGRHCQSCCKTVVDFTEMSDAEIIRYLSQAGPHVCGRLMPHQLNRSLVPAPVQKNGRSGWAWVLASLLMLARGSDNGRPVKAGKVEMRAPQAATDHDYGRIIGVPVPRIREDSAMPKEVPVTFIQGDVVSVAPFRREQPMRIVPDTDRVEMGTPVMERADSIRPPGDTLPVVSPATTRSEELEGIDGGIVVGVKIDSAALGWRPASDLNIYPNPVPRGGAIQLAWKTQPGQYQLTLMNMRGQLIAERLLDVGGAGQVDSWEIPASLAAGVYVLRVVRPGRVGLAAPCTREVIVR